MKYLGLFWILFSVGILRFRLDGLIVRMWGLFSLIRAVRLGVQGLFRGLIIFVLEARLVCFVFSEAIPTWFIRNFCSSVLVKSWLYPSFTISFASTILYSCLSRLPYYCYPVSLQISDFADAQALPQLFPETRPPTNWPQTPFSSPHSTLH